MTKHTMFRYLKPDEAAALMGLSPKTLANWRTGDYGPPWTHAGKVVRYLESDIISWMESSKVRPSNASSNEEERKTRVALQGERSRVLNGHRLGRHATQS